MAPCLYSCIRGLSNKGVSLFFRDIHILNEQNIPLDGPIIIVANHNNQFVDAGFILKIFRKRVVSFIIAEASMHRPIVGDVAKGLRAVPVIRPQDRAKVGSGALKTVDLEANVVIGEHSKFVKEAAKGGKIVIKGVCELVIDEVISDSEIKYKITDDIESHVGRLMAKLEENTQLSYKIYPKVDQKEVYSEVYNRLLEGGAISIFPEGGSHDNTHLLPLKAGVAVMALGAIAKGAPVRIVPVGINYLQAYSFRSRVIVDVGEPFDVSSEWVESYNSGERRAAYEGLMGDVKSAMEAVTLGAPNWSVLYRLRTARRMYQNGIELSSSDYYLLYRRFLDGYESWKGNEDFQELLDDIGGYLDQAKSIGLSDKGVVDLPVQNSCFTWIKTWNQIWISLFVILILFIIALPGMILNFPIYYLINKKTKREVKKALAKSTVKVKALDVAASQKALNFIKYFPLVYLFNALVCGILIGLLWEIEADEDWKQWFGDNVFWFIPVCMLLFLPFYTYFVVLVIESAYSRMRLLPIRLHAVWTIYKRKAPACLGGAEAFNPSLDIRLVRRRLVIKTQDVIGELTANDEKWQNNPIIDEATMLEQRKKNLTNLVDYVMSRHHGSDSRLLSNIGDADIDEMLEGYEDDKSSKA
mmetsp:Transcript_5274/g.6136  ORF Transcript_5274/g.6136 Transcript_5274/m.6136 type:complete len:641 (+) Transcript_5274:214-2136(+)